MGVAGGCCFTLSVYSFCFSLLSLLSRALKRIRLGFSYQFNSRPTRKTLTWLQDLDVGAGSAAMVRGRTPDRSRQRCRAMLVPASAVPHRAVSQLDDPIIHRITQHYFTLKHYELHNAIARCSTNGASGVRVGFSLMNSGFSVIDPPCSRFLLCLHRRSGFMQAPTQNTINT